MYATFGITSCKLKPTPKYLELDSGTPHQHPTDPERRDEEEEKSSESDKPKLITFMSRSGLCAFSSSGERGLTTIKKTRSWANPPKIEFNLIATAFNNPLNDRSSRRRHFHLLLYSGCFDRYSIPRMTHMPLIFFSANKYTYVESFWGVLEAIILYVETWGAMWQYQQRQVISGRGHLE